MKDSARNVKIVEWSDADQCYVGTAPGLIYGGCHGANEKQVFDQLVAWWMKRSRSIDATENHCLRPLQGAM